MVGSGNMGQNNRGVVPLSGGLDTRPCKILDPRLWMRCVLTVILAGLLVQTTSIGIQYATAFTLDFYQPRKRDK